MTKVEVSINLGGDLVRDTETGTMSGMCVLGHKRK